MGRRRGGVKYQQRRAFAIACGKDKTTKGHNVSNKLACLYRELEEYNELISVPTELPKKPTIVSELRFFAKVQKFVYIETAERKLVLEATVIPVDRKQPYIPVVQLD